MKETLAAWRARVADLWGRFDELQPDVFVRQMDLLAAERTPGSAEALFERGSAQDSVGHADMAVPLYQAALAAGLGGTQRRRATIQMASSLRNLGDAGRAAELLTAELAQPADDLSDAVCAFLALALADLGREREALAMSLAALSRYLPRYNRSLRRHAESLLATQR